MKKTHSVKKLKKALILSDILGNMYYPNPRRPQDQQLIDKHVKKIFRLEQSRASLRLECQRLKEELKQLQIKFNVELVGTSFPDPSITPYE